MDGIDPNIALSVKPVQIQNPNEWVTNAYAMKQAQMTNQLNQMKMDEYSRGLAEQEQFKNELARAQTPEDVKNAFYRQGKVKEYNDLLYKQAETTNLGYTGKKTQADTAEIKAKHATQMLRDLSQNPSNANLTAHFEDIQNSSLYTDQEKQTAKAKLDQVMQMTIPERQAYLASQGATASDLKPHIQTQNLGGTSKVSAYPAFGGAPTTLSTDKITATPGELLTKDTAIRGQNLTDAREKQRLANDQNPNIVSHQQVSENGTVTNFNKFGQVIGTVEGAGKPSAQFTKTKEQTKKLNTDLNLAITELDNATKDGGLIDQSTGSGLGKAANAVRGFVTGGASEGAIAGAKLAPIADLALKMVPRFEGPQSDKDTQSYKEAAGQLADTSIPNEIRKQAGRTVLRLMKARKNQFVTQDMAQEGVVPSAGGVDSSNPLLK